MFKKTRLKRAAALALAAVLSLGLAGCAGSGETTTANAPTDAAAAGPETAAPETTAAPEATAAPETASVAETTAEAAQPAQTDPTYSLVQNVYNWGSSYSKAVIPVGDPASLDYLTASAYRVNVERFDVAGEPLGAGERTVLAVYRCDEQGREDLNGSYAALAMGVGASSSLASPYYTNAKGLKDWADCRYTIENLVTGDTWDTLDSVYHPDEEGFATGVFTGGGIDLPYASYEPAKDGKHPLIVWLHGMGSGGTDIGFVTGGMLVTNFISEEVQKIFDGAYILLPQAETMWMDASGNMEATTDGASAYTEPLMALIEDYVAAHENVDPNRIYVGGCSNGGYMTIRLMVDYPDYFAAGFPVCEAFADAWLTDADIETIKDIPTWFVHCAADPVVDPATTTVATYDRMTAAGAQDVHFTFFEAIADPEYGNAYGGHFSWVYSLLNLCSTDYDGEPVSVNGQEVTLYEWLGLQSK